MAPAGAVATQGGQGGARKALGEAFRAAAAFAAAGPSVLFGLTGEVQGNAHPFSVPPANNFTLILNMTLSGPGLETRFW